MLFRDRGSLGHPRWFVRNRCMLYDLLTL
jgi:hypothetical protein